MIVNTNRRKTSIGLTFLAGEEGRILTFLVQTQTQTQIGVNLNWVLTFLAGGAIAGEDGWQTGLGGIYRKLLQSQHCGGHPGLLDLQCTQEKEHRTTLPCSGEGCTSRRCIAGWQKFEKSCCRCNEALRSLGNQRQILSIMIKDI